MKRLSKKIILLVVVLGFIIIPISTVKGALQANPDTYSKKEVNTPDGWMTNIRNMEKTGEAMGLSETLNNDLTPSSESNNIDVHLARSTEYGAVAILSASGYGNPQTLQESEIKTTTGNKTGVYFTGTDGELVAGGLEGYIFSGVNSKYYDTYTNAQSSARVGDALGNTTTTNQGCLGWHLATNSSWVRREDDYNAGRRIYYYYFVRGQGGIFSYITTYVLANWYGNIQSTNYNYSARGVASCGQGL